MCVSHLPTLSSEVQSLCGFSLALQLPRDIWCVGSVPAAAQSGSLWGRRQQRAFYIWLNKWLQNFRKCPCESSCHSFSWAAGTKRGPRLPLEHLRSVWGSGGKPHSGHTHSSWEWRYGCRHACERSLGVASVAREEVWLKTLTLKILAEKSNMGHRCNSELNGIHVWGPCIAFWTVFSSALHGVSSGRLHHENVYSWCIFSSSCGDGKAKGPWLRAHLASLAPHDATLESLDLRSSSSSKMICLAVHFQSEF